jgi:hypothetical protein
MTVVPDRADLLLDGDRDMREQALRFMTGYWRLTDSEAHQLMRAILHSQYTRAQEFRQQFALIATMPHLDVRHVIHTQVTPAFVVQLVEDLVHEKRLSRADASGVQDKILQRTSASGAWT